MRQITAEREGNMIGGIQWKKRSIYVARVVREKDFYKLCFFFNQNFFHVAKEFIARDERVDHRDK